MLFVIHPTLFLIPLTVELERSWEPSIIVYGLSEATVSGMSALVRTWTRALGVTEDFQTLSKDTVVSSPILACVRSKSAPDDQNLNLVGFRGDPTRVTATAIRLC